SSNRGAHLEAAHVRQHDVEQNHVPGLGCSSTERLGAVGGHRRFITLAPKIFLQAKHDVGFVLDDQNAMRLRHTWQTPSTSRNVLPRPSSDSSSISPSCAFRMCRTIARPTPVPLIPRRIASSPRTNLPKIFLRSVGRMPKPSSVTTIATPRGCASTLT